MNSNLFYAEGFAVGAIPVLHAWNVTKDGVVVDSTWDNGMEYFGVIFKQSFVFETLLSRERYGIIDNMEQNFPLLRGVGLENVMPPKRECA
jgi:hypothetical protein